MDMKSEYKRPEIVRLGTFADLTRMRNVSGKNDGAGPSSGSNNKTIN